MGNLPCMGVDPLTSLDLLVEYQFMPTDQQLARGAVLLRYPQVARSGEIISIPFGRSARLQRPANRGPLLTRQLAFRFRTFDSSYSSPASFASGCAIQSVGTVMPPSVRYQKYVTLLGVVFKNSETTPTRPHNCPATQMRMACRPYQRGARYAELIMLSSRQLNRPERQHA